VVGAGLAFVAVVTRLLRRQGSGPAGPPAARRRVVGSAELP
jgi:hypothetical protein